MSFDKPIQSLPNPEPRLTELTHLYAYLLSRLAT